jgi:hypothetical protein
MHDWHWADVDKTQACLTIFCEEPLHGFHIDPTKECQITNKYSDMNEYELHIRSFLTPKGIIIGKYYRDPMLFPQSLTLTNVAMFCCHMNALSVGVVVWYCYCRFIIMPTCSKSVTLRTENKSWRLFTTTQQTPPRHWYLYTKRARNLLSSLALLWEPQISNNLTEN